MQGDAVALLPCCLVALTVSHSFHFGFLSLSIIGCLWQNLSIWKALQQLRLESSIIQMWSFTWILVILSQQISTTSSDFQFFSLSLCPSLMDSFVIFFIDLFIFPKPCIRLLLSQNSHNNKCQCVLEGTAEERPLRHYQKKSIKCGVEGSLNTKQRQFLLLPLTLWRLQTFGVLIPHWADGDVDQSGDEEGRLSSRLPRMKRRSMQLGDITSKSFLPARIWAPFKKTVIKTARIGPDRPGSGQHRNELSVSWTFQNNNNQKKVWKKKFSSRENV